MTKDEIQANYMAQHDALGSREDADDKELFDLQHAQVWADCDAELKVRKLDLGSKDTLTDVEWVEFRELEELFPAPAPPIRNLAKEIDELKVKVEKLGGGD